MGYVEILTSKVNGLNKKVRLMYCVLKSSTILKRCSFFFFDVKYSMLGLLRCTIHRIIRPNAFDVLYIEFSTYCIFRDRCMRPYTVITLCKATCYWKITITCKPKNMKCCFRLTHLIFTAEYLSLGTSNWAEDYFSTTAGVAFVFNAKSPVRKPGGGTETFNLRDQVKQL